MKADRPLRWRLAAAAKSRLRRWARPLLIPLRDWQAPHLHCYMMHRASKASPVTDKPALIIAPHHDDETFGCGGVIALKCQAGVRVDVVILTDGKQSHGDDPSVDKQALMNTRQTEALAATAVLGLTADRVQFFNLPDQGLRSLDPAGRDQAVEKLARLIVEREPGEIYITHRSDPHPDHQAGFTLTIDAIARSGVVVRILQYPIWLIWKGPARLSMTPRDLAGALRVDVRSMQDAKNHAIQLYASQLPVLPAGFVGQFTQGYEVFFVE